MIIIHAMKSSMILPCPITPFVEKALRVEPMVVVTGERRTGKSTLVCIVGPEGDRLDVALDDIKVQGDAVRHPSGLLNRAPRITLGAD